MANGLFSLTFACTNWLLLLNAYIAISIHNAVVVVKEVCDVVEAQGKARESEEGHS